MITRPDAHNRTCVICGKHYTAYDRKAKYCSQECYNQYRAIKPRQCPACGKLHTPSQKQIVYCSKRCINRTLADSECSYCGRAFHPRTKLKNKFCCLNCYHASMATDYPRSRMNFSAKEKALILKRDNFHCVQCGATEKLEFDHILAVCNGGQRTIENGQTLCVKCHDMKTVIDKALARNRLG